MPRSWVPLSTLVIDSSVAVWFVLPTLAAIDTGVYFSEWTQAQVTLVAPILWLAECTSAVRRSVYTGKGSAKAGRVALNDLLALPVELLPLTAPLCLAALDWAARLRQAKAYDSFYLALADQLSVEFWSADQRLISA